MQDSIEDYIKITCNTKEQKVDDERKKEIILMAKRKKECEDYSLKIVEFLIEGQLKPEIFVKCLKHINQELYQDIVEERAITKICGYPLCGMKLPDMPKKQYYISTKQNKVYDITDRKNYCCNFCYKASLHVKHQIENSPLWLRKPEDVPHFNLLLYTPTEGLPGKEVDHGLATKEIDNNFTSVTSFAEYSLNEVDEMEVASKAKQKEQLHIKKNQKYKQKFTSIDEENEEEEEEEDNYDESIKEVVDDISNQLEKSSLEEEPESSSKEIPNINKQILEYRKKIDDLKNPAANTLPTRNVTKQVKSKKTLDDELKAVLEKCKAKNKNQKTILYTDVPVKPKELITNVPGENTNTKNNIQVDENEWEKLKTSVKEWISLDTYIFLHGFDSVKQHLNKSKLSNYFDQLKVNELQVQQQLKYMNICKRLQLREVAEEKFDKIIRGEKLSPLPDYEKLKEQSNKMKLKVHSFYEGSLYTTDNTNFPIKNKDLNDSEMNNFVLPLNISKHDVMRRKVFINSINKMMNIHTQNLELSKNYVMEEIQLLVKTFKLQANNTVFKAVYFDIISIILIEILSVKNNSLHLQLDEEKHKLYVKTVLDKYPNGSEFVEEICLFVNDVDTFVKDYICKNDLT